MRARIVRTAEIADKSRRSLSARTPRVMLRVAVGVTVIAVLQQFLITLGFGGWLPGWQPLPLLLGAAPAWLLARPTWRELVIAGPVHRLLLQARRFPAGAYLAGLLLLTAGLWAWLQDYEPHFAHEEAVYANKARSWLGDTPDAGWGAYRPIGLPALGSLALSLHNDAGALRLIGLLLGLFTIAAVYFVASRWGSRHRAILVTLILLSGLGFLRRLPEFLNDIGSTGLLLIAVFLIVRSQEERNSRALFMLPFVLLAAFYLRYGVVGNMLAIFISAFIVYGPRAWGGKLRQLAFVVIVVGIGLLPHFIYAVKSTGSPLGLIFWAAGQAERKFVGDGLLYYSAIFPYRLAGDLGGVVMMAGVAACCAAVRRVWGIGWWNAKEVRSCDQRTVFLGVSALLICVILGVATDGEPRFIYLPVILLTVLGVTAVADLAGARAGAALMFLAALAGVTTLATAQVVGHGAMPRPEGLSESTRPVAQRLSGDDACLIVTGYEPEMGWYSGCDAVTFQEYRKMKPPKDAVISFVLFERGRLQPSRASLDGLIRGRAITVRTVPTTGSIGDATVISIGQ